MSDIITSADRDAKSGRFLTGNTGGGRKPGARNLLSTQFLEDLKTVWEEDGIGALRRCAREDAAGFCRIVAGVLPKDVDITVSGTIDVGDFAERFRNAVALLHDHPKTIEHDHAKRR